MNNQYVVVSDKMKGDKFVVKGPKLLFPGPYEEIDGPFIAPKYLCFCLHTLLNFSLKETEYIRVTNEETGKITVEKGAQMYFPGLWLSRLCVCLFLRSF